jgi:endonuclease/exonuclease/phosphatase family metal-dependent hydrolase
MMTRRSGGRGWRFGIGALLLWLGGSLPAGAVEVRVGSWNLQNYLVADRVVEGVYRRAYPKPEAEKAALREVLLETRPDVLAIQETGDERFLLELQRDLARDGLDYPHRVWMAGADEHRHLALLSRLPPAGVWRHDELSGRFLGRSEPVKRGLLEVAFVSAGVEWRLFNLHLKSRFTVNPDDPSALEQRNAEATAIRNVVAARIAEYPALPVLVAGDFNDHPVSRPLRRFLAINDRPLLVAIPVADDRGDTWTHFYAREEAYERIDFFLAAPAMIARVRGGAGWIPDSPVMRRASDHRLILCRLDFSAPPPAETKP